MYGLNTYDGKPIDPMWDFLFWVGQKSNVKQLKENCESLRRAFLQKTAGQKGYRKANDVDFDDLEMIFKSIAVEAYVLFANGDLDKIDESEDDGND